MSATQDSPRRGTGRLTLVRDGIYLERRLVWTCDTKVIRRFVAPEEPMQNGFCESLTGACTTSFSTRVCSWTGPRSRTEPTITTRRATFNAALNDADGLHAPSFHNYARLAGQLCGSHFDPSGAPRCKPADTCNPGQMKFSVPLNFRKVDSRDRSSAGHGISISASFPFGSAREDG
jgi:hypothetical protein